MSHTTVVHPNLHANGPEGKLVLLPPTYYIQVLLRKIYLTVIPIEEVLLLMQSLSSSESSFFKKNYKQYFSVCMHMYVHQQSTNKETKINTMPLNVSLYCFRV